MLVLAAFFMALKDNAHVKGALTAVRPAVVALLALTVYNIFPKSVTSWDTALIMVISFVAVTYLKVHPALVILMTAILGVVFYSGG